LNFFPTKIPKIIKRIFPNYVWDFSSKDKTLYLTFDDGPTPKITEWTLKTLKAHNAKATFFCIGNNVENHPSIFESILKEGHAIGNHTHNHLKGWKTHTETYLHNVEEAQRIIDLSLSEFKRKNNETHNCHKDEKIFRPPFGKIKNSQGKALIELGYKIIMWSIIAYDWDCKTSKEQCLKNIVDNVSNGDVIVFHDSEKASRNMMYALPKVLEHFCKKGYQFKAIETV